MIALLNNKHLVVKLNTISALSILLADKAAVVLVQAG